MRAGFSDRLPGSRESVALEFHILLRFLLALAACFLALAPLSHAASGESVELTAEEREWIVAHPEIRVGNELDWPPFDFAEDGVPKGYSIDLVKLIAEKVGLQVKFVNGYPWSDLLEQFRQGELDVLPAMAPTVERREFASFTEPYIDYPLVIVVNKDEPDKIAGMDDLQGEKVAIVKGYYYEKIVREKHPDIDVQAVEGFREGLEAVQVGQVRAFIGSRPVTLYSIREYFLNRLRIAAKLYLGPANLRALGIGVRKDEPHLLAIINKGLAAVTQEEINEIRNKWIFEPADREGGEVQQLHSNIFEKILLPAALLFGVLMVFIWLRIRKYQGERKAGLILLITLLLIIIVGALFVLRQVITVNELIDRAEVNRFDSIRLATQLRQTSDDLTRMARTYVVTGEQRFEKYFDNILAIRNGTAPRPLEYETIYWDYVAASGRKPRQSGDAVALEELMRRQGISGEEFTLLHRSKAASDALVMLEERAMNAVKGIYQDVDGNYTRHAAPDPGLARKLLHGDAYHSAKAQIMAPIEEFQHRIDARTNQDIQTLKHRERELSAILIMLGVASLLVVGMLLLLVMLWLRGASDDAANAGLQRKEASEGVKGTAVMRLLRAWPLFIAAAVACVLIVAIAVRNQMQLEEQARTDIGNMLTSVLNSTHKAAHQWLQDAEKEARIWARHEDIADLVSELNAVGVNRDALLRAPAQVSLQIQLGHLLHEKSYIGFLIVKPGGLVVSSSSYSYVGKRLKSEAELEFINASMQAPMFSAVSLPQKGEGAVGGTLGFRTILMVGAAVIDRDERVVASLILMIDPQEEFTEILQRGRMGASGESYAFNTEGQLISESRFDEQLQEIGLVQIGERGILNIEIRDPGGNMVEGFLPTSTRSDQPLTLMARTATAGTDGMNLEGYNDYRGVPVIGAWLWNESYGFGLTTEIDVAEAYASMFTTRYLAISVAAITAGLILALTGLFAWNRLRSDQANERLQRSEQRISEQLAYQSALLDAVPNPIYVKGQDTTFTACNSAFEEAFGIRRDDLVGKKLLDLECIPHDARVEFQRADEVLILDGGLSKEEVSLPYADGNTRDVMYWRRTFDLPDGTAGGMIGILIDVTERKRSEERFKSLLDSTPDPMVIVDDKALITYVNSSVVQTLGYERDELLGKEIEILVPESVRDSHPAIRNAYLANPSPKGISGGLRELSAQCKDGRLIPVDLSLNPIHIEGEGLMVAAALRDITEHKKMQAALSEAKELAEDATRAKSDFLANMSHEIRTPMNAIMGLTELALRTELNPKQQDYLNKVHLSAKSLLGIINDILDFSKIEAGKLDMESVSFSVDQMMENLATVVNVKTQEKGLELLFSRQPEVPPYLIGDPLRLGQVLINLCNNAVKFTETGEILVTIKQIEQLDDRARLEFSIQDTGIGMNQEQLGKMFQSFSQADTSTSRKYGGTGLGLAISKQLVEMMDGTIWVESEPGEGSKFSFQVWLDIDPSGKERDIKASGDIRGMPVLIVDDNPHAREILTAYITQFGFKADAVSSGEAAIARLQACATPYRLVIMDYLMPGGMNGLQATQKIKQQLGLTEPPKVILITAFSHSEYADTPGIEEVDNELSKPVNPSLLLDVIMETFGHEVVTASRKSRNGQTLEMEKLRSIQGARILLTEDNLINQQVATEFLQQAKFIVDIAGNGQEALDKLAQNSYDCVLMDVNMPVMDGYTATHKIREQAAYKDLPVLAMTANAMVSDQEEARAAGMNDHIAKPIEPQKLFAALLKWIEPGERELPDVTEESPPAADETASLPDQLSGIDIDAGLQRVGGNPQLFRKLLGEFYLDHGEDISAIRSALEQGDNDTAKRLAHTIKGVAATIGADELNIRAKQLESAIGQGQMDDVADLVEQLTRVMTPVLEALSGLVSAQKPETTDAPAVAMSFEEFDKLSDELEEMLEEMDPDAEEKAAELFTLLGNQIDRQLMKRLRQQVSAFEFEEALQTMTALRRSWVDGN